MTDCTYNSSVSCKRKRKSSSSAFSLASPHSCLGEPWTWWAKGWHCSLSNFQCVWGLGWFVHSRVNVYLIQLKYPALAISNLSWWPGKIHCKWLGMAITQRLMWPCWLGHSCHQHLVLTILVQSSVFFWFPSQSSLWKPILWQAVLWNTLLALPWQMQFGFEFCLTFTEPHLLSECWAVQFVGLMKECDLILILCF